MATNPLRWPRRWSAEDKRAAYELDLLRSLGVRPYRPRIAARRKPLTEPNSPQPAPEVPNDDD
jgi:hypothetical protein